MPVTHGGICDQRPCFRPHPFGKFFRAVHIQPLFRAGLRAAFKARHHRFCRFRVGPAAVLGFRMTIYRDISNIGRPVLARRGVEQLRRCIDEPCRIAVLLKVGMRNDVFQKQQIGRHAANPEFPQCPVHTLDRLHRGRCPCGHFFQKRIVESGDHSA